MSRSAKMIMKRILGVIIVLTVLMTAAPLEGILPTASAAGYKVGDIIEFGSYPQTTVDNDYLRARLAEQSYDSNGVIYYQGDRYIRIESRYYVMLPITWRVLSVDSDGLYIMAEKILDCQKYHYSYASITWADCSLRTWLNGYFFNLAFSDTEKQKINTTHLVNGDNPWLGTNGGIDTYDKVFVPSVGDVLNTASGFSSSYNAYDSARFAKVTPYAQVKGALVSYSDGSYSRNGFWWLRTPGCDCNYACNVSYYGNVYSNTYIGGGVKVVENDIGVRPALKLSLNGASYQSKDNSNYQIKVVDDTTAKPISGAKVTFNGLSVTTSANGTAEFSTASSSSGSSAVTISKSGYATQTLRLYELNPYGTNTVNLSSESNPLSMALANIYLNSDEIQGPTVSIMNKKFPLFSFNGGLNIPLSNITKMNVSTDNDTKNKTVKYILGVRPGYSFDSDEHKMLDFQNFKDYYKLALGGSTKKAYEKYNALRDKLMQTDGSLGFDCGMTFAGYLEFSYATGNMVLKDGGITVTADAKVSVDIPFWEICYATFKIGGEIEGGLKLSQNSSGLLDTSASIGLSVKPTFGLGVKVLSKDLASVELGINGKINGTVKIPASSLKNSFSAYLNANAYVKVKYLMMFENSWSTNFPNVELYPNFGNVQTNSVGGQILLDENGNIVTIDESDLKLIDRSYLNKISTQSYTGDNYLNDTSVFPYGYPQLTKLNDGRTVAMFVYDDGTKSDINRTTLYYSVHNGNTWSKPVPVYNSGLADFSVKVCTDGEKVYAVWLRASQVLENSYSINDIPDKTELVYSEFGGSGWTEPVTVDSADKYQMMYSIAEHNGKVAVEWAENSVDSFTLSEGITTVYYKTLENGVWSGTNTVASSQGIAGASAGFFGDSVNVMYIVDGDGNLSTSGDSEIYLNGMQMTDNNVDDGEISFQNNRFYWIEDSELCSYDGISVNNSGLKIENDYRILNNGTSEAVTYLASDGFKNELMVSYLADGTYTKPVKLTDYGRHISYYDSLLNEDSTISVLADVDNLNENPNEYPYTTTDMVCSVFSGKTDIGISDVFVNEPISAGSEAIFNGKINNSGTVPVSGYTIKLKNSRGEVLTSKPVYETILPGESKDFNIEYLLPTAFTKQDITAEVEADSDSIRENNQQTVTVGYADIEIVSTSITQNGLIKAVIANNGLETATNVKLKISSEDTSLSTITVGSVGIGETVTAEYNVPHDYLIFENYYSVNKFNLEATTDSEETAVSNNDAEVVYAPIAVEGITLNTSAISLEYGSTAQLTATVYPSDAFNKTVHWISDSIDVATVDDNGKITTVGNGTAIITAITDDGDFIAQCEVTVSVKVTGVTLNQENITVNVGNTVTLNANVNPEVASDKTVTWSSSDDKIAAVDENGTVRGIKTGIATIKAKTTDGGFEAECTVNVINAVTRIVISDVNASLYIGKTKQLSAQVTPENADNQNIVWTSSDDEIATVNQSGLVTAVGVGTATVTAKSVDGNYTVSCNVKVGKHVSSIILSDNTLEISVGKSDTIIATVMPLGALDKSVTWISTNPKVATVDEDGNIYAVKAGTTTIMAYSEDGDVTAECTVTVSNSVTGFDLSENEIYISRNKTYKLDGIFTPDTAENKNIKWESEYPGIASVDSNGLVSAKMAGTTMITATTEEGGYKAYCTVKVVGLETLSTASIDSGNGIITGLAAKLDSLDGYIKVTDDSCELKFDSLGTNSVVYLSRENKIIDAYTVVIFGDVNGDGVYDGMDAVTVSMLAAGMLTKEQVGEAVYMAADCNHDGVIDEKDVDLLEQAGLLLASVDQSKTQEELKTDSVYAQYLNLIDQNPVNEETNSEKQDNANDETGNSQNTKPADNDNGENNNPQPKANSIIGFIADIYAFLNNLINLIKTIFA